MNRRRSNAVSFKHAHLPLSAKRVLLLGAAVLTLACALSIPIQAQLPIPHESTTLTSGDTQSTTVDIGDPINAANAEYHFQMGLVDLGGVLPVTFDLYYGSQVDSKRLQDGLPARFIGNQRITLVEVKFFDPPSVYVELGLGQEIGFHQQGNGWVAYDLEAVRYQLKETAQFYHMFDPVREWIYTFSKDWETDTLVIGLLVAIQDRNGNTLTYEYPNNSDRFAHGPDRVYDDLGRELRFTYQSVGFLDRNPYLVHIEDQNGRSWRFTYEEAPTDNRWTGPSNSNVVLRSLTDPLGNRTTFEYNNLHRITAVQSPAGNVPYTQTYDALFNDRGVVRSQTDAYDNTTRIVLDEFESRIETAWVNGNQTGIRIAGQESQFTVRHPDGSQRVFRHQRGSRVLESIADEAGNTMIVQADPVHDRFTGITDRLGDTTGLTYHPDSGKLASYTDAEGNTIQLTYTPQQQRFTNPLRSSESLTFTAFNLTQIQYPDGQTEQFTYDSKGRLIQREDRAGSIWNYAYNGRGQVLTSTNPMGGVVRLTYHADATLASRTDSDTGVTTFAYDRFKRLITATRPDGKTLRFTYDQNDRILTVTDERGQTTTFSYDANGRLTDARNAQNQTTTFTYDLMDRLQDMIDPLDQRISLTYDERNRLATMTDRNGHSTVFDYDARGWLTQVTDPAGHAWRTTHDAEGVPVEFTTPLGFTTAFQTDKMGRNTRLTDPLGAQIDFVHDSLGRPTSFRDRMGRETGYSYDAAGRLEAVTRPVIGSADYLRNDLGRLVRMTDLRDRHWDFDYSPMGRLISETDPLGNQRTQSYDQRGRLQQVTYADGQSATVSYDASKRVTQLAYSPGPTLDYTYDASGRLLSANDLVLTYDDRGDIINSRDGAVSLGAGYDADRQLATLSYDDRVTVSYTYDARGLLTRVADDLSGAWMTFSYDVDTRLIEIHRSNGVSTGFTYDAAGRVIRTQDGTLADQQYTLNAEGEPTKAVMHVPLGGGTVNYSYDDAGRLIQADYGSGKRLTYTYDRGGNLVKRTGRTPLEPAEQLVDLSYDDAAQVNSPDYTYDSQGRQRTAPGRSFTYDGASQLSSITTGNDRVALTYNGLGDLRTRSSAGTTTTYYHSYALGWTPIVAERQGGTYTRFYVYTPGGALLYSIRPATGDLRFYHYDRAGSTLMLTDGAGTVTDAYAYSPYGGLLDHTGASKQPFTFVGRYGVRWEPVGGLYDMRARAYDPIMGRFLRRDPLWPVLTNPVGLNPYQYARQNPMHYIDPLGTDSLFVETIEAEIERLEGEMFRLGGVVNDTYEFLQLVESKGGRGTLIHTEVKDLQDKAVQELDLALDMRTGFIKLKENPGEGFVDPLDRELHPAPARSKPGGGFFADVFESSLEATDPPARSEGSVVTGTLIGPGRPGTRRSIRPEALSEGSTVTGTLIAPGRPGTRRNIDPDALAPLRSPAKGNTDRGPLGKSAREVPGRKP